MKKIFIILVIVGFLFTGCATLSNKKSQQSSFLIGYFQPGPASYFTGAEIRSFSESNSGQVVYNRSTRDGYYYSENIEPGKYYIRSFGMSEILGKSVTYYWGSPLQPKGFEESSFIVGPNEVKFIGSYSIGNQGLSIFGWGGATISRIDSVTKKDCLIKIIKEITNESWKIRLNEELLKIN